MLKRIDCPDDDCDGEFEVELVEERNYGSTTDNLYGQTRIFIDNITGYCLHKDDVLTLDEVEERALYEY